VHSDAIVIIPARGGSTRIPGKNIREFNAKPMIAWPIEAALSSVARVVVSTDDPEIAEVATRYGAEVPFSRPGDLATNEAGTAPVIRHAIEYLGVADSTQVICLYPTAALGETLLREAIQCGVENPDTFTITVGRHRSPLERALAPVQDGKLGIVNPDFLFTRTQDLPTRYFDAGKFYGATATLWLSQDTMMSKPFTPYFLPEWAAVDIDEEPDWLVAEALHRAFGLKGSQ
jgi:pseudaminic acid cytidylyltransferase